MKLQIWLGAVLVMLVAVGQGSTGEPQCCPPPEANFLQRIHPVGGWHPDCGGLLHWWNPRCFPCCGGPDDYCRKPLPRVCCPAYPAFYKWATPESCCPQDCSKPH
jgi:hypothetical protein